MKEINFDVAQALVNYVARDGDSDSLKWATYRQQKSGSNCAA